MRLGYRAVAVAAAALLGSCKCGSPDPERVGGEQVAAVPITAPPTETKLPLERPTPFAVTYMTEKEDEHKEQLRLGTEGGFQSSERGRRAVRVVFSPIGPVVEQAYAAMREYACDLVETKAHRAQPKGGSMLQIRAGSKRVVVNDRGVFYPTEAWAGAYEGCARAMDRSFPDPGDSGYVELDVRYPGDKIPVAIAAQVDVGPDHRGLGWRDGDATATLYVAKVRPVDVVVVSGKQKQHMLIDLATQRGVEMTLGGGERPEVIVEAIDGAAKVVGTVGKGPNARMAPLGAPPKTVEPMPPRNKDGAGEADVKGAAEAKSGDAKAKPDDAKVKPDDAKAKPDDAKTTAADAKAAAAGGTP